MEVDDFTFNVLLNMECMSLGLEVMIVVLNANFSYIVAVSFVCGGNGSTRRKPPTCHKSLTTLSHIMLYRVHIAMGGIPTHNVNGDMY